MSAPSPLSLLPGNSAVQIGDTVVRLTAGEHAVLRSLVEGAGEPVEHAHLLLALYGDRPPASNCLEVLISRLRVKLVAARAAQHGVRLLTRRGVGYQLVVVVGGAS